MQNAIAKKVNLFNAACKEYNKRFLVEEFGFVRNNNASMLVQQYGKSISECFTQGKGSKVDAVPWMFWMFGDYASIPNDMDVWINDPAFEKVIAPEAQLFWSNYTNEHMSWPELH